jgi:hypothetical protein
MADGLNLGITVFFGFAVLLLALVTVGVGYLTFVDWQDKRRRSK